MFLFIIGAIAFAYTINRIVNLEIKVRDLEKGNISIQEVKREVMPDVHPAIILDAPVVVQEKAYIPKEMKSTDGNSEFALGSQVFTIVGVLALLIGVGFFLRYAFENNYITESMRVVFGLLLGAVVCSAGAWIRKTYVEYGSALFGAGLGILYVSVYAAYDFYHLIETGFAFFALILVTLIGLVAALVYDSLPLISYSLAGAFIITFLLPLSEHVHEFFVYILVLNALVIGVTTFKRWPQLAFGGLFASLFIIFGWMFNHYNDGIFVPVSVYLTLLCGSYSISVISNFLRKRGEYKDVDGFLLPAIPVVYILLHFFMVEGSKERSLILAFIGAVYVIGFGIVRALARSYADEHVEGKACSSSMLLIGSVSIAGAIGLHFDGEPISYLWALQALALIGVGSMLKSRNNRVFGIILAIFSLLHMYALDYSLPFGAVAFFNSRTVISLVMTLVFATMYAFYKFYERTEEDEYRVGTALGLIVSIGVPLLWLTIEIQQFVPVHASEYVSLAWMLYGLFVFCLGLLIKETIPRFGSYVIVFIGIFLGFIQTTSLALPHSFLFNIRFGIIGAAIVVLIIMTTLFRTFKEQLNEEEYEISTLALIAINFLALCLGSFEIVDYYQGQMIGSDPITLTTLENTKRVLLSLFYLVYGAGALTFGIMFKSYFARVVSFILFAIAVLKIFLYDTANLSDVYRFISFITLGVIFLVASYAYYRFKDRIVQFVHLEK